MRRFRSISIALASLTCVAAVAATRPRYGGTLHVTVQEMPQSFDPSAADSAPLRSLSRLVFETLVKLDDHGRTKPWLASSWQVEPGNQRWRFQVRSGVILSDGTPLDANTVAASLRSSNPQWKVFVLGDLVMIETGTPDANVPAELALSRNSIVHSQNGALLGTGAYAVAKWDSVVRHLTLNANNDYWGGRPFIDSIEVDFGKSYRDQMMSLDLGKSDFIEVSPEEIRSALAGNRTVIASAPEELMSLVFNRGPQSDAEIGARNLLARNIDTASLNNVVFQGGGEPSGALLPGWLSGYGFLFSSGSDHVAREKAQHVSWTLSFDSNDTIAHIIADRVLLNARDAGITLQTASDSTADIRLVRTTLPSLDPEVDLSELARNLGLAPPAFADSSVNASYSAERTILQTHRIVPLLHLRSAIAVRPNVHDVAIHPDGTWNLSGAWLSPENP